MSVSIRSLKRRYKVNLAMGKALPPFDLGIPLPVSTGNPLYDSALATKLVPTRTLDAAQHLKRSWELIRSATSVELNVLSRHAGALMNDQKLLLALHCWDQGHESHAQAFLRSLPWARRLAFPTSLIKPAASIFSGWKRDIPFRLVDNPRYDQLYREFRQTLEHAPPVILLKYRRTIKEAAALLHFRFEGERERAIHDWCFGRGDKLADMGIEPLSTYVQAREALASGGEDRGGVDALLNCVNSAAETLPLTSYTGLLGSRNLRLNRKKGQPRVDELRDYAVRCATPVELLLSLSRWSTWLTDEHIALVASKVRKAIETERVSIPFHRVMEAFSAAPDEMRKRILHPLFIPLLKNFGKQVARALPPPGPITWIQPGGMLHFSSFMLFAALASAGPTRLLLVYKDGVEEIADLDLDRVAPHLADDPHDFERWLLSEFGGLSTRRDYDYDYARVARRLNELSPEAPLVFDVPFGSDEQLLAALLPFERVFNLNGALGAPGELSLYPGYYSAAMWTGRVASRYWHSWTEMSAIFFAELLERVLHFQELAAEEGAGDLL